jgi:2-iminobutanoate/2-iminopropanoate deaminase
MGAPLSTRSPEKRMSRQIIRTDKAPAPPPVFSQAVKAAGLVFVSGHGPFDPATGLVVGETAQEQTRQCLRNVSAVLEAAGSSLAQVVSATVIFAEDADFPAINEEWLRWFPTDPPARQGARLPVRPQNMKVSIAVVALA